MFSTKLLADNFQPRLIRASANSNLNLPLHFSTVKFQRFVSWRFSVSNDNNDYNLSYDLRKLTSALDYFYGFNGV